MYRSIDQKSTECDIGGAGIGQCTECLTKINLESLESKISINNVTMSRRSVFQVEHARGMPDGHPPRAEQKKR